MTLAATDPRLLMLAPGDSVYVLRAAIDAGEAIMVDGQQVVVEKRIGMGHKLAAKAMGPEDKVIKYGAPIGSATQPIAIGEHVHLHNLKSDYTPTYALPDDQTDAGVRAGIGA
jgi:hypothetical protein